MPVSAPTFSRPGLDAEAEELLERIAPTAETSAVVAEIARTIKGVASELLPGAEVTGFVSAALCSGRAFGVAVPEVDIVISASLEAMASRLGGHWVDQRQPVHVQKLRKSAVRACTDRLVGEAGFKFRRSAFRGDEPRVTMVASQALQGVPLNLYVNAVTPLYRTVLLDECGRLWSTAQELALLVKRWAKDRALCHSPRGHLSPYAWALMTIFFLQVAREGPGSLPPLAGLITSTGLSISGEGSGPQPVRAARADVSLGSLFRGFLRFYCHEFDWCREAVSVRLGARERPGLSLPLHLVFPEGGGTAQVGPSIEDPFEPSRNLGACATAPSLRHLREELLRAHGLCEGGASLSELLEPWAPEAPAGLAGGANDER